MTTLTVEIEKAEDLAAVKNLFEERGLNYEVGEYFSGDFNYTDEIKQMLHEREEEYLKSDGKMVTPEESRAEIQKILAGKK